MISLEFRSWIQSDQEDLAVLAMKLALCCIKNIGNWACIDGKHKGLMVLPALVFKNQKFYNVVGENDCANGGNSCFTKLRNSWLEVLETDTVLVFKLKWISNNSFWDLSHPQILSWILATWDVGPKLLKIFFSKYQDKKPQTVLQDSQQYVPPQVVFWVNFCPKSNLGVR